ncbi:transposase, partial [Legionella santicrucis]|uniref:transposase n=1 Tax=Legionella santicrucis TaxID=45074 RepID=UPI0013EF7E13
MDMLDLYSDYLIFQNKYATATGLSDLVDGAFTHDKVTRFLRLEDFGSKSLWSYVKKPVRTQESVGGVLIVDDSIEEKPYTDENEINCWHYSHAKGTVLKGINILTYMIRYDDFSVPIGYEVIKKDISYSDIKSKQTRKKSSVTKNQLFQSLIAQAITNKVMFDYVLADNWFGSKVNMVRIHKDLQKSFIIGIKSNRTLALSENDANNRRFQQVRTLEIEENVAYTVWLRG